jgi:pre-mRNA-splicing factor CWC22
MLSQHGRGVTLNGLSQITFKFASDVDKQDVCSHCDTSSFNGRHTSQEEKVRSCFSVLLALAALTSCRSRSRSPDGEPPSMRRRSLSPPPPRGIVGVPRVDDVDPVRRAERERQLAARMAAVELEKTEEKKGETKEKGFDAVAEFAKLTSSRSGGVYMPPARLRALQAAASQDRSSAEYQRLSWDALRKSITGIVNRINVGNIKHVVPELFSENLIRGRGLFARSIMKAQAASLPFTPVFAALVSIINTKLPMIGELLLHRLISQFRRAFKRNDKVR